MIRDRRREQKETLEGSVRRETSTKIRGFLCLRNPQSNHATQHACSEEALTPKKTLRGKDKIKTFRAPRPIDFFHRHNKAMRSIRPTRRLNHRRTRRHNFRRSLPLGGCSTRYVQGLFGARMTGKAVNGALVVLVRLRGGCVSYAITGANSTSLKYGLIFLRRHSTISGP